MLKTSFQLKRISQSMLEYATLIVIVSGALIAMYKYVHWSLNVRLKEVHQALHERLR